jgi:integrase
MKGGDRDMRKAKVQKDKKQEIKGLYRRGQVYWVAYKVSDGSICRESTGEKSQEDAEFFLAKRRKQVKDGEIIEARKRKNNKFGELAKDYLECCVGQKAYYSKKFLVRQLVERFGNLKIRALNTEMIEKWQSEQLRGNMPGTVNRKLTVLKHIIKKGNDWGKASDETLKQVCKVKKKLEENTRLRFLNVEECQTLIDCCASHLKPIVTVALHTGMRRGEILGLKWEQVDLKHGFILLEITKNGERREIPIDNTLMIMFNSMPRGLESVYVFTDPRTGEPYKSVQTSFETALKRAEIRDFRFHDLRHTFASHLVMAGVDLTSIRELLGHKSLAMTIRYAHLAPGHKRRAVNMLDKVLKSTQEEAPLHSFSSQFEDLEPRTSNLSHKSL